MKTIVKRTVAVIMTLCLLIIGLYCADKLTRLKSSYLRDLSYKSYYECPDEYDVLFLGTSHMLHGVNPLILWHQNGIKSYNWASPTCTIPMMYWKLKCITETSVPDMIVVDCYRANWSDITGSMERMHQAFDAFPLTVTKCMAVQDLLYGRSKDKLSILFPMTDYHSRWDDLQEVDFNNEFVDVKGCEFEYEVAKPIEISRTKDKLEMTEDMKGVEYLRKILDECKEKNIDVLLTYLPYPTDELSKMESNMISDIAVEYGVDYLNFTDMDIVNYDTDFADSNSHMNYSGMVKVSKYLGNYIADNYNMCGYVNDKELAKKWDTFYEEYISDCCNKTISQNELSSYLMCCYDLPFDYVINIHNIKLKENKAYEDMLEQLGINTADVNEHTEFIIVHNKQSQVIDELIENEHSFKLDDYEYSIVKNEEEKTFDILCDGKKLTTSDIEDYDIEIKVLKNNDVFDTVKASYFVDERTDSVYVTRFERE